MPVQQASCRTHKMQINLTMITGWKEMSQINAHFICMKGFEDVTSLCKSDS